MPQDITRRVDDLQVERRGPLLTVVLVGLPPVYAHGLQTVLQESAASCVQADGLDDVARLLASPVGGTRWVAVVPAGAEGAVLAAVASASEPSAARLAVVVVLDELTTEACAQALQAGVTGVLSVSDAPGDVVSVVSCAGQGQTVLPRRVVQALCRPATTPAPELSSVERAWLRRLAAGLTVAGLARANGYSEREMYRRLSSVYLRLGARTRTEALLIAERAGLLADHV